MDSSVPMRRLRRRISMIIVLLSATINIALHAQNGNDSDEDLDAYKLKISALLFYSSPFGYIQGSPPLEPGWQGP